MHPLTNDVCPGSRFRLIALTLCSYIKKSTRKYVAFSKIIEGLIFQQRMLKVIKFYVESRGNRSTPIQFSYFLHHFLIDRNEWTNRLQDCFCPRFWLRNERRLASFFFSLAHWLTRSAQPLFCSSPVFFDHISLTLNCWLFKELLKASFYLFVAIDIWTINYAKILKPVLDCSAPRGVVRELITYYWDLTWERGFRVNAAQNLSSHNDCIGKNVVLSS